MSLVDTLQKKLGDLSPRWHPGRFRATLVVIVASAVAVPLLLLAMPYIDWFNDMAVQPKGKAQSYYGWFTGEQHIVQRPPVEGTVHMSQRPPYPIDDEDPEVALKRAGEELTNPRPRTRAVMAQGQKIFETICIVCHGLEARGDGKIVGPNLFPAPPSLHTDQARAFPDGRIYHVITRGQNNVMPSYADVLDPDERWAVVHYVRVLQQAKRDADENDDKEEDR